MCWSSSSLCVSLLSAGNSKYLGVRTSADECEEEEDVTRVRGGNCSLVSSPGDTTSVWWFENFAEMPTEKPRRVHFYFELQKILFNQEPVKVTTLNP